MTLVRVRGGGGGGGGDAACWLSQGGAGSFRSACVGDGSTAVAGAAADAPATPFAKASFEVCSVARSLVTGADSGVPQFAQNGFPLAGVPHCAQ